MCTMIKQVPQTHNKIIIGIGKCKNKNKKCLVCVLMLRHLTLGLVLHKKSTSLPIYLEASQKSSTKFAPYTNIVLILLKQ
jgi:hypothetical protein